MLKTLQKNKTIRIVRSRSNRNTFPALCLYRLHCERLPISIYVYPLKNLYFESWNGLPPQPCGHGCSQEKQRLSVSHQIINMLLIHENRAGGGGCYEELPPLPWWRMYTWLHNDLRGEQAQAHVTNLLACDRIYTAHLFSGDSLAVD